ncbi:MAG: glycosyltransferase family 4 protein, partial [Actinomycetota bacterium]
GAAESAATVAIGSASAVVCVTEAVAAWARLRTGTPQQVHCVANGVDTRRIRPVPGPVTGCDATIFTIGFVGTLKPWHGVETLIDALALLAPDPAYRLLLVGDGPQAAALAGRAARLGVADRVEATGSVDPARMPEMLRRMDVATAPYPAIDGFYFSPLKVYEYLAAGVPVVASRVGTLPELLRDGELGELVRPGDAAELARAVEALRHDPARRARLRVAGAEAARAHDWSRVVDRCLEPVGLRLPGAGRAVA